MGPYDQHELPAFSDRDANDMTPPEPVGDDLNATRSRLTEASAALAALDADAGLALLRETAAQVGNTLIQTATDDALWARLSQRSDTNFTAAERARLRAAVSINWVDTLNALGYQPPPPTDTYGTSFVRALSTVIVERDGRNIGEIRAQVRELGTQLVALTALPTATPSRFRKWLRRGSRVVRSLAVAAGVAAATVVIGQAVMPAATAAAIAAATAPLMPGHIISAAVIVDVVNTVTKKSIELVLNAALGHDPAAAGDDNNEDSATTFQRARQNLGNVSVPQIRALAEEWSAAANAEHAKPPVAMSLQFIGAATISVHLAAVAAAAAAWATVCLLDQFNAVLALASAIDDALHETTADAAEVSAAFTSLAEQVAAAQAQLDTVSA